MKDDTDEEDVMAVSHVNVEESTGINDNTNDPQHVRSGEHRY